MSTTKADNLIEPTSPGSPALPWHRSATGRTFIAIAVGHALIDLAGGVWPLFKNLAQLDLAWAGFITTVSTVLGMGLQPLFGYWADQGHRRLLLMAGIYMVCTMVLLGPAEIYREQLGPVGLYIALLAIMVIVRMGQAMFHPPGTSLAGNTSVARRSTLVAVFISAGMVGFACSWFLFAWVYDTFEHNTLWLLVAFVPLVIWIGLWCKPDESRRADRPSPLKVMGELLHMGRAFLILYLIQALMSATHQGLFFLLPEFIDVRGQPTWFKDGGGLFCFIFGSVILMIPTSHYADRLGRRGMLQIMLVLSVIAYGLLMLISTPPLALLALLLLLTGGCLGATNPLGVAIAQHLAPTHASVISGLMMGFAWMLGGIAPFIMGYLVEEAGVSVNGSLYWLLIPIGAAALLSLWVPKLEAHDA